MRILIAVFIFSLVLLQASASALVFDFGKIWGQAADTLNEQLKTCEFNTGIRILVTSGIPTTQQNANDLFQGSSMATQGMPSKNLLLMYSTEDKRFFMAPSGHPLAADLTEAKLKEDVTSLVEFVINNLCGVTIIQPPAKTCTSNADCPSGVCTGGVCQAQPPGECNKDGKCDSPSAVPPGSENHKTCPDDCPSGGKDGYCDGVKDGKCDPDCSSHSEDEDCATGNQKDMKKYTGGTVFLVSDQDWKSVMGLMSVAMWKSDGQSCNDGNRPGKCLYPLLIWHDEGESWDADSILWFFEQYKPDKVYVIGDVPQDFAPFIPAPVRITLSDYLSFWEQRKLIVVSEPDYSTALLASVYATKNNAPLIFSDDPNLNNIIGTNITDVVTVGNVNLGAAQPKSVTKKQLSEIQANSDKVILTMPTDSGCVTPKTDVSGVQIPPYSNDKGKVLSQLYCKNSLLAPALAFAKDEYIVFGYNIATVYSYSSTNKINYMTILASPNAFPQSTGGENVTNDELVAGNANNGEGVEYWGRIYGVTPSDTSSYVARAIFFTDSSNTMLKPVQNVLLDTGPINFKGFVLSLKEQLKGSFNVICQTQNNKFSAEKGCTDDLTAADLGGQDIIVFDGHSLYFKLLGTTIFDEDGRKAPIIPDLSSTFAIASSCNTNKFELRGETYTIEPGHAFANDYTSNYLFGAEFMRKGGIGFIGAILQSKILDGQTLQNGWAEEGMWYLLKSGGQIGRVLHDVYASDPYGGIAVPKSHRLVLYGDPTITLNMPNVAIPSNIITYYDKTGVPEKDFASIEERSDLSFEVGTPVSFNIYTQPLLGNAPETPSFSIESLKGEKIATPFVNCVPGNVYGPDVQNAKNVKKCSLQFSVDEVNENSFTCSMEVGGVKELCPFIIYMSYGLEYPKIAISGGNIYVVDTKQRILKFDLSGNLLDSWGFEGYFPKDIEVSDGYIFVADEVTNNILKYDLNGNYIKKWNVGGPTSTLSGLAIGGGNAYVSDADSGVLYEFDLEGNLIRQFGGEGSSPGQFAYTGPMAGPGGIKYSNGKIYVADRGMDRIQVFDTEGNYVLSWNTYAFPDSASTEKEEKFTPSHVEIYGGVVYVIGQSAVGYVIQKFDINGNPIRRSGTGGIRHFFERPYNTAIDSNGKVFAAEEREIVSYDENLALFYTAPGTVWVTGTVVIQ